MSPPEHVLSSEKQKELVQFDAVVGCMQLHRRGHRFTVGLDARLFLFCEVPLVGSKNQAFAGEDINGFGSAKRRIRVTVWSISVFIFAFDFAFASDSQGSDFQQLQ
jgi:hypothetical protein